MTRYKSVPESVQAAYPYPHESDAESVPLRPPSRHQLPGREVSASVTLDTGTAVVPPKVAITFRIDGTVAEAVAELSGVLGLLGLAGAADDGMQVRIGARRRGDPRYR